MSMARPHFERLPALDALPAFFSPDPNAPTFHLAAALDLAMEKLQRRAAARVEGLGRDARPRRSSHSR
jgi:hypothetical protein